MMRKKLFGALLLSATTVGVPVASLVAAAPAFAHSSSYCGHGTDGTWDKTIYQYSYWDGYGHVHAYWHDMRFGTDHWGYRYC